MKKDIKIMLLALIVPITLFGVGYAYAQQFTTDYVRQNSVPLEVSKPTVASVSCDSGDFPILGEYQLREEGVVKGIDETNVFVIYVSPHGTPSTWTVLAFDHQQRNTLILEVYLHCTTPITVAGIGVSEFGGIYITMFFSIVIYVFITRIGKILLVLDKRV